MAKVYYNQKEFLVIQINAHEATELDFGIQIPGLNNMCLCGTCNNECKPDDIYYIAGINEFMCKECCDDYCSNMNHFIDDDSLKYEVAHFNHYAQKLNMNERAAITPNSKLIIYDHSKDEDHFTTYT